MSRIETVQDEALRKMSFLDDSIYIYKIKSNSQTNNILKDLLPMNPTNYTTRFHLPFYPPIPKNLLSMTDPIFRLCTLGNIFIALHKPFLTQWNASINFAVNIIDTLSLIYG